MVGQAPAHFGLARSGWWLDGLRQAVSWLTRHCLATVYQTLQRAQLCYKRGRRHVHSPDALYAAKLATVTYVRQRGAAEPERIVALYLDELTYYRRPTVAGGYAGVGCHRAPLAEQGWGANTLRRIAACLDPRTGRLVAWQRRHFDRRTLARFYREAVVPAYPDAQRIYVLQDNWPVHFHPDLLAALADTPIRLVRLPTYAPWTNPVEKVWRWLYADVLHLHRFAGASPCADPQIGRGAGAAGGWDELIQTVQAWLDQFDQPSESLLRYVGLLCPH